MTRARDLAVVAAAVVWWSPTIALAVIRAAPHFVAIRGRCYRIRRVRLLIDRGRVDEADRVIAALHRELDAWERWHNAVRP